MVRCHCNPEPSDGTYGDVKFEHASGDKTSPNDEREQAREQHAGAARARVAPAAQAMTA